MREMFGQCQLVVAAKMYHFPLKKLHVCVERVDKNFDFTRDKVKAYRENTCRNVIYRKYKLQLLTAIL